MNTNQKKHAVKGMSLVEVIISVVVLTVATLILAQIGQTVNNLRKNSMHVSNRVTIEKPYVTHVSNGFYEASKTNVEAPKDVRVTVDFGSSTGHDVELKGQCYQTKTDEDSAQTFSNSDLQFVNIDLSKHLTPKKTADGYYEMKTTSGKKIYKKGDDYYDEDRNKIDLEAEGIKKSDIYYDGSENDSNIWINIAPEESEES